MNKENEMILKELKKLKIAVIAMAVVIVLLIVGLWSVYSASSFYGSRIYNSLKEDIKQLELEQSRDK